MLGEVREGNLRHFSKDSGEDNFLKDNDLHSLENIVTEKISGNSEMCIKKMILAEDVPYLKVCLDLLSRQRLESNKYFSVIF